MAVIKELRPCYVAICGEMKKALFHIFTKDGNAIVELEDGCVMSCNPALIKFADDKIYEYFL
ncbi:hypothetical protein [Lachnoclostridium phytofermentans]|uniref:hypothetical protein n=1 Tax=Lachnoclostridium phytofermentans TaxID=66219 RepID=UPI000496E0B5|nr:hypothetical protein [Lachnoclostridium phytofermentans]